MDSLDRLDCKLLDIMQNDFPLSPRPYLDLAERLNIGETEVLERIRRMKKDGVIRRTGAILDSRRMGYYSTLCACKVEAERIDEVAGVINARKGVTHNYVRDHRYNVWFTLTVSSYEEAMTTIYDIEKSTGVKVLSMPTLKPYKIKVSLNMGDSHED
ncbi:siroheme decarboxylase subunit alpha [Syntrophomonas curvata]